MLWQVKLSFSQQVITGRIADEENKNPVLYASVLYDKGEGVIGDSSGKFIIRLHQRRALPDSVFISAVGYKSKKIAVHDLLKNDQVYLQPLHNELQPVKVFTSIKGDEQKFGYYRAWDEKNTHGEIGYVFTMPSERFFLGAVQVKLNHNYDTCWLKLHLRDVGQSGLALPENEILKNEVILPVTVQYGMAEFDLQWQEIRLSTNKIYVGFELIRCGQTASSAPSFFFMGNEKGQNYFRENINAPWQLSGEYTIYVRLLTRE